MIDEFCEIEFRVFYREDDFLLLTILFILLFGLRNEVFQINNCSKWNNWNEIMEILVRRDFVKEQFNFLNRAPAQSS